jgi:hypothetical protein
MKFDEWYEANKEALTTKTLVAALRQAFEDGGSCKMDEVKSRLLSKVTILKN